MAAQQTGTSGFLIIEDSGSVVTFRIQNTSGATHASGKSWSGVVNGGSVGGTFSISGAQTVTLGSWSVGYTQTVTLSIANTGTSGLGGPSSFSVAVHRATVPPPPVPVGVDEITPTSMRYRFNSAGDGGSQITSRAIQASTSPTFDPALSWIVGSTGTTTFTGLSPATRYYFRAREQNGVGVGDWCSPLSAMTDSGAYASINGGWVPVPLLYDPDGASWLALSVLSSDGSAPWNPAL